ncbi:hypothetical protein [Azospira restricta]|uniref:Zinc-ribbon domain-containing protein n=1 Tax=Azospira restricta TaxID=404405 RepID=A0A974PX96_9RHOO|nr:hypothetical protein [Azospira restricta]QRJ62929.1 hypothetical protein IWH25_14360 [Azospira restricta]
MPLVPCRACGHTVDTSAQACPGCGATDPGRKISRQQRELRSLLVQLTVALLLFGGGAWYLWHEYMPTIKAALVKQNQG